MVRSLWLLQNHLYWILMEPPLCYPVCHGDPAALALWDRPFHKLQHFTDEVDVGVYQLKALDLGLGGSCVA